MSELKDCECYLLTNGFYAYTSLVVKLYIFLLLLAIRQYLINHYLIFSYYWGKRMKYFYNKMPYLSNALSMLFEHFFWGFRFGTNGLYKEHLVVSS